MNKNRTLTVKEHYDNYGGYNVTEHNYIERYNYDTGKVEMFTAMGIWANNTIAYSRITKDENGEYVITFNDNCTYYQSRYNGRLEMAHV